MSNDVRITSEVGTGPLLLKSFRDSLENDDIYSNVSLICKDGKTKASGLLLAALSPVLQEIGKTFAFRETEAVEVFLPDFSVLDIKMFLDFLTAEIAPSTKEDVGKFESVLHFFSQTSPVVQSEETAPLSREVKTEDIDIWQDASFKEEKDTYDTDGCDSSANQVIYETRRSSRLSTRRKATSSVTGRNMRHCAKKSKEIEEDDIEVMDSFDDERRVFVCKFCGAEWKRSDRLANHLKWHFKHPGENYQARNTCKVCGRFNATYFMLKVHMKRMHSELPKPFICDHDDCGKAFRVS